MKILDCTLRDGGYYTHWDFSGELVEKYLTSMSQLPIECIELGYRGFAKETYEGEFYFLPENTMKRCRNICSTKRLSIMINAKDVDELTIRGLLLPALPYIDMVRIAVKPKEIEKTVVLLRVVKEMGFEVGLNIMYMSTWDGLSGFYESLAHAADFVDCIWMVDSYGGMLPEQTEQITRKVKKYVSIPLGFHGHNNLELAFANSIVALKAGCEWVDCTISGMGRGAGNLKTELLLTYLSKENRQISFPVLGGLVHVFGELQKIYQWGGNVPYMISGTYSLPQQDIMDWMGKNRYSVDTIIQILQTRMSSFQQILYPMFDVELHQSILLVGGGDSVCMHQEAIMSYLDIHHGDTSIIFTSSKHLKLFEKTLTMQRFICLVGSEGRRLESQIQYIGKSDLCVIPDGMQGRVSYVPECVSDRTYTVSMPNSKEFPYCDSPLYIALQMSKKRQIYLIGFDGYEVKDNGEYALMRENQTIIDMYDGELISLLPTKYANLTQKTIYALI